jgi:hypothetical protein
MLIEQLDYNLLSPGLSASTPTIPTGSRSRSPKTATGC